MVKAETWDFRSPEPLYRFFELFDLPNLPSRNSLMEAAEAGGLQITPPLKPYLEEKLWFGLFWSKPLMNGRKWPWASVRARSLAVIVSS